MDHARGNPVRDRFKSYETKKGIAMSGHKGLYDKYEVRRKETGEICEGCFILRPTTDEAARIAVATYAYATHNPQLRIDILRWLAKTRLNQASDEVGEIARQAVNGDPSDPTETS